MEKYIHYTAEELIQDEKFVEWVLNPDESLDKQWNDFLTHFPHKKEDVEKAIALIRILSFRKKSSGGHQKKEVWQRIQQGLSREKTRKRRRRGFGAVAASAAVIVATGFSLFLLQRYNHTDINYADLKVSDDSIEDTRLIFSDQSEITAKSEESSLEYTKSGDLRLNEQQVRLEEQMVNETSKREKLAMNQIIVPKGKRANLTFSDGTRLWLNSGSHAIYPVHFSGRKREIYIEGEGYLDVNRDPSRPFIVKTPSFNVKVLGTEFNINAYPVDEEATVVLVEGSVEVKEKSSRKTHKLKPNQLLSINKRTNIANLQTEVNILEHVSWKDGWMLCNSRDVGTILKKLSFYYDKDIVIEDAGISDYRISGKLDLKDDIDDVLYAISATAPITYTIENNTIRVKGLQE